MHGWLAIALISTACGQASDAGSLGDQPPEPPHLTDPAAVARGMHVRYYDQLRKAERLLVAGDLEGARLPAAAIAGAPVDPGLDRWATQIAAVQAAARAVAEATTASEALQREPRVAAACAECHIATGSLPKFRVFPPLPIATMARHQWAVDRLWDGMVGAADEPWIAGLDELARGEPPRMSREQQSFATRLQRLAARGRGSPATDSLDDRTATYGAILVSCAGCHAARR